MPLSIRIPSGEQTTSKKKVTSRKRRQNQNAEIDELASLVSLPTPPQPPSSGDSNPTHSLVPSCGSTPSAVDKISVLRLTTTFLKLHDFMKSAAPASTENSAEHASTNIFLRLMQEAMDGFLIVLDKEANILYVSETITGYVGLSQQEVIGQNLIDITHSDSAAEIADCLKPSVVSSVTMHMAQDCAYVISQYRQFFLKFKSTVANSRYTTHTLVQVSGNLKVKIPPLKNDQLVEVVEPSVVGFIGECSLIKSSTSILEVSIPHSTFTSTVTLDFQPISIESRVKEIIGYDIEDFIGVDELDFIHPADYPRLLPARQYLVDTGHSVSPHFRFLCKSGDWLWMQVEGTLHCKAGTSIPLFYEYKARVLSQEGGRLKYIEQKELYASSIDPSKKKAISRFTNPSLCCSSTGGVRPILNSLKSKKMPESAIEPVLQARSATMRKHSELIKLLVSDNSTDAAQAKTSGLGGCSGTSNNGIATSSASRSTSSVTTEQSTNNVTRVSSTSQNGSVSWDSDSSMSPASLQSQAVSPLSVSSESQSPSTPQVSPSPPTSSGSNNDSTLQIGWLTSQNHSMQDLQGEPFDPSARYQPGVDQSGVQRLLDSDMDPIISSPANLIMPSASPVYSDIILSNASQQQCAMSPGQFLDQASPLGSSYGSVISGTSSLSDMAVSDVPSPPTVFSPEVGTVPAGDDSIPLSAFSIPFQNSQTSTLVPQASTLDDFNPQIPSNFNFSITHQNFGTALSNSHPSVNVEDTQSARYSRSSHDPLLMESQRNMTLCSSNSEIQDILQQFF